MYRMLAVFAGVVGLGIAGAAVFSVWYMARMKKQEESQDQSAANPSKAYMLRWTALDYANLLLTCFGALFLLTDVIGVIRDRNSYPYYHYGYLLSGFVFMIIAAFGFIVRLSIVLRIAGGQRLFLADHARKPDQADQAE